MIDLKMVRNLGEIFSIDFALLYHVRHFVSFIYSVITISVEKFQVLDCKQRNNL